MTPQTVKGFSSLAKKWKKPDGQILSARGHFQFRRYHAMADNFQGKYPIQLNDRDFKIFQLIRSEGAKTSTDLEKQFWSGKSKKAKAAFQRIRKLVEAGLLDRGNPKLLYLSDCARNLLTQKDAMPWVEEVKQIA